MADNVRRIFLCCLQIWLFGLPLVITGLNPDGCGVPLFCVFCSRHCSATWHSRKRHRDNCLLRLKTIIVDCHQRFQESLPVPHQRVGRYPLEPLVPVIRIGASRGMIHTCMCIRGAYSCAFVVIAALYVSGRLLAKWAAGQVVGWSACSDFRSYAWSFRHLEGSRRNHNDAIPATLCEEMSSPQAPREGLGKSKTKGEEGKRYGSN